MGALECGSEAAAFSGLQAVEIRGVFPVQILPRAFRTLSGVSGKSRAHLPVAL
jgi:hypothetical protein